MLDEEAIAAMFRAASKNRDGREMLSEQQIIDLVQAVEAGALSHAVDRFSTSVPPDGTLLQWATEDGLTDLVRALLAAGADPNRCEAPGRRDARPGVPPLILAVGAAGSKECAQLLLEAGARIGPWEHTSPLHVAAKRGHAAIVDLLLRSGADPLLRDALGHAPVLNPNGRVVPAECAKLLRAAAAPRLAAIKQPALQYKKRKRMLNPARDLGVEAFLESVKDWDGRWELALVRAPVAEVGAALARAYPGSRLEADAGNRTLADAADLLPAFQLRSSAWTIVLIGSGGQLFKPDRDVSLELSRALATEAIRFASGSVWAYNRGELQEEQSWADEEGRVRTSGALQEMHQWFARREILVPAFYTDSDGYIFRLVVSGLKKGDVERLDIVVLEEFSGT